MRRHTMSFNKKLEDNNPYDKDALKVDKNYKKPIQILCLVLGVIGAIILAIGTMMVTNQTGTQDEMWIGLAIGCVGAVVVSFNYSLYCTLVEKKAKELLSKKPTKDKPAEDVEV
jgi:uncharacterized membrane protein YeaQ/YmgE (transglycosylase-associated protein family)